MVLFNRDLVRLGQGKGETFFVSASVSIAQRERGFHGASRPFEHATRSH